MSQEINTSIQTVSLSDLYLDQKEIALSLGYGETTPNPHIQSVLRHQLSELSRLDSYTFGYRHIAGEVINKQQIQLADTMLTPKTIIIECFKGSSSFILLAATIGKEANEWIAGKQSQGDILDSFIADALGSVIVEAIVAYAMQHLEKEMLESGMKVTNSYSPGYCGWDVKEQALFFSLLPPAFCGITLTESSLMLPVKSVSALIGVGKGVERKGYGCEICKRKDCYKRKDTK